MAFEDHYFCKEVSLMAKKVIKMVKLQIPAGKRIQRLQ